jgi:hypothetical protein
MYKYLLTMDILWMHFDHLRANIAFVDGKVGAERDVPPSLFQRRNAHAGARAIETQSESCSFVPWVS